MLKLRIYVVILSVFIFWVISTLFTGVHIENGILGYILIGALFGITMLASGKIIRFLTLKENLLTSIVSYAVLSVVLFFILSTLTPLIYFNGGLLKGFSTDLVIIKDFVLDKNTTLALFAILCGTINALVDELRK